MECGGRPHSLTFIYIPGTSISNSQGGEATVSGSVMGPATVTCGSLSVVPFATLLSPYESFTVRADYAPQSWSGWNNWHQSLLPTQLTCLLHSANGDQTISMHTSCSRELKTNDIFGSLLLAGYNGNTVCGGNLQSTDLSLDTNAVGPGSPPIPCVDANVCSEGPVASISFRLSPSQRLMTGQGTAATLTDTSPGLVSGGPAQISCNSTIHLAPVGLIVPGTILQMSAGAAGELPESVTCSLTFAGGVQVVHFMIGCSGAPLFVGDVYGSLELVGYNGNMHICEAPPPACLPENICDNGTPESIIMTYIPSTIFASAAGALLDQVEGSVSGTLSTILCPSGVARVVPDTNIVPGTNITLFLNRSSSFVDCRLVQQESTSNSGPGFQTIRFESSCNVPLARGDTFGSLIASGFNGLTTFCTSAYTGVCELEDACGGIWVGNNRPRIEQLHLLYTGLNSTRSDQDTSSIVMGDAMMTSPVRIQVSGANIGGALENVLHIDHEMRIGDVLTVDIGASTPDWLVASIRAPMQMRSGPDLHDFLDDNTIAVASIRTDCRRPLRVGDSFGPLSIQGYASSGGSAYIGAPRDTCEGCPRIDTCVNGIKPTSLTMLYDPARFEASLYFQSGTSSSQVRGEVSGAVQVTCGAGNMVRPRTVQPGQLVEISGPFATSTTCTLQELTGTIELPPVYSYWEDQSWSVWSPTFWQATGRSQRITFSATCQRRMSTGSRMGSLLVAGYNGVLQSCRGSLSSQLATPSFTMFIYFTALSVSTSMVQHTRESEQFVSVANGFQRLTFGMLNESAIQEVISLPGSVLAVLFTTQVVPEILHQAVSAYGLRMDYQGVQFTSRLTSVSGLDELIPARHCSSVARTSSNLNSIWHSFPETTDPNVCGTSKNASGDCFAKTDFVHAAQFCYELGARLCNIQELRQDEPTSTGCSFNSDWVWSSSYCPNGITVYKAKENLHSCVMPTLQNISVRCCAGPVNASWVAVTTSVPISAEESGAASTNSDRGSDSSGNLSGSQTVVIVVAVANVIAAVLISVVVSRRRAKEGAPTIITQSNSSESTHSQFEGLDDRSSIYQSPSGLYVPEKTITAITYQHKKMGATQPVMERNLEWDDAGALNIMDDAISESHTDTLMGQFSSPTNSFMA